MRRSKRPARAELSVETPGPPRKSRLTKLSVEKLKPDPERSFLVWDTHRRGLSIRVQPSGSKSWKCIYSGHCKPRRLHLGKAGDRAIGLAEARKGGSGTCSPSRRARSGR
jgi:hypothetical protein